MKLTIALLLSLVAPACLAEVDTTDVTERAQPATSNCDFIPGCELLLDAEDPPFLATLTISRDEAGERHERLDVVYRERPDDQFLPCYGPPHDDISFLFVTGPETARRSVLQSARLDCPSAWGDNGGHPDTASLTIKADESPALWNELFPPLEDGSRWYALQVAAVNGAGQWDSRHGQNYRLVLTAE